MPSTARCATRWRVVLICLLSSTLLLAQGTGGRILGRVADPTGAVLANVKVTAVNEATGVSRETQTNESGDYVFPEVPVGTYRVEFDLSGFKKNIRRGVSLDINQVITLNMIMQIGETKEVVEVTSEAPLVDTTSTQLGTVVNDRAIVQLPLNQRDTYQFLSLQPGVSSQVGADLYYGGNNVGSVSVNGGRGRSNNFNVNGGDANDMFANLPTVQPNPDSVEEFRILTNTFDAEYGRNSGSVVNVVTKSGTNQLHGNVYEFLRNRVLNARGYFDTTKPGFVMNQFGGTLGGPIKKDQTFFFASYEGLRRSQGQSGDVVRVPDALERTGDFSGGPAFTGVIGNQFVADVLNSRGPTHTECAAAIAAAGGVAPAEDVAFADVFPGNVIPPSCQDPVAVDLLRFVPSANTANGFFQAVLAGHDRSDQVTVRFDHRINDRQQFTAYYYFNDENSFSPFNTFQAAGANVPGFGDTIKQRFQQWNLSHTWTISNSLVNEARFTYMREAQGTFGHSEHTNNVIDSCTGAAAAFCFTGTSDAGAINDPANNVLVNTPFVSKTGITPGLGPQREGVPDVDIAGGFVLGNNFEGEIPQVGNSFQWTDNLTKVAGNHTLKFGGDLRRMRFDQHLFFEVSGFYNFNGGGTNDAGFTDLYPNYLLGLPDIYQQGAANTENVRTTSFYLFGQDSWKIRPNLTLNYGLRWELNTPLVDIGKRVQTFRPGQATSAYPCQISPYGELVTGTTDCTSMFPTGLVFPGDSGVPAGLTQTYYKAFAPRVGIAWSPGSSGKTSIRAGWGLFYNPIEQLVLEQFSAEPPFGGSVFLVETMLNTPFYPQSGGFVYPNPFNGIQSPPQGQAVDWTLFRPALLFGEFQPHMRSQYSAQYNLTIQRELAKDLVLQVGYVGSQGHRLLATNDLNRATPQTCLDIFAIAQADPSAVTSYGDPATCNQLAEDNQFTVTVPNGFAFHMPNGSTVAGTGQTLNFVGIRPYSSPNCNPADVNTCAPDQVEVFSNIFALDTIANSNYNSLQVNLEKRFSRGLQLQAAYTLSKSIDQASSFEDVLNPFNARRTRSLSLFDTHQRFVLSYYYELPIPKASGVMGKMINGWAVSGITQFQSGFPIHIASSADNELTSSVDFSSAGLPDQLAPFQKLDPRSNSNNYAFNPNSFTDNAADDTQPACSSGAVFNCFQPSLFGRYGNAPRTICCGPGLNNWDLSVQKSTPINERMRVEFRWDIFNLANHTRFFNPDGNVTDGPDFGRVSRAADPRLMQVALKLYF
jgi:outer membrane receptor protein involved in Fe transport